MKKKLLIFTVLAQIIFSMFLPISVFAQAPDVEIDPNTGEYTKPEQETSDAGLSETSLYSDTPTSEQAPPDTYQFKVTEYLTAEGQGKTYFEGENPNPIGKFIIQVINFLVFTLGSATFLAFVIGGFFLIAAQGEEQKLTKGKDIIKYALIGLIVTLSAYLIVAFIQSVFYEIA